MITDEIEERIERGYGIDRLAEPVHGSVRGVLDRAPRLREALRGRWLGHPLHAALTDIPVGAWTAAFVLDLMEMKRRRTLIGRLRHPRADAVIAIGLVGALGAAVAGMADWSTTRDGARRVGFVHGVANMVIAGLYGASLYARKKGQRRKGIVLSSAAYAVLLGSAWLGGELAYKLGVGVRARPFEWGVDIGEDERLADERVTSTIDADVAYVP